MDHIHRHLTGESVHLADWPAAVPAREDARLTAEIDTVRRIIECGRSIREKARINLRQPLARLLAAGADPERVAPYRGIIEEQVNVKAVECLAGAESFAARSAVLDAKKLGPLLKGAFGPTLAAVKAGDYAIGPDGALTAAGTRVEPGDFSVAWQGVDQGVGVASDRNLVVGLDLAVTPDLKREGLARMLNRLIQDQRKKLDLAYDQRVVLRIEADGLWREALDEHRRLAGRAVPGHGRGDRPGCAADRGRGRERKVRIEVIARP